MQILAKTLQGLEEVLAEEIKSIGGQNIQILTRAVSYEGNKELLYKSNILLRTALRILEVKKEFTVHDEDHLYRVMFKIPWEGLMDVSDTFLIDCTTSGEIFTHSKYAGLRVKDAIADRFRKQFGKRPSVNILTPTYRINVHIRDKTATLSLDSSGESLHMRGYRVTSVDAPVNEVMAAGLVLLSGWDGQTDFLDPMCGGGTIPTEAAFIAYDIPPQKKDRAYGFKKWKNFNKPLFEDIIASCYDGMPDEPKINIIAADKSLRAVKVTEQNLREAGIHHLVKVIKQDFFRNPHDGVFTLLMNPPYDERLKVDNIDKFYKQIGDTLKQHYSGSTAYIYSGNIEALKNVGLRPEQKIVLKNAGIDSRMYKFSLYEGYGDE